MDRFGSKNAKVVKRQFPGPAGLLPEVKDVKNLGEFENIFCSQNSVGVFNDKIWLQIKNEFKDNEFLFENYNIAWIEDKAKSQPFDEEVPFLVAKVKRIERCGKKPIFTLQDPTGEIEAVISKELYEDISEFLTVNSALILKGFRVLCINSTRKLYVVITPNNLVKIYGYVNSLDGNLKEGAIQIVSVGEITNGEIKKIKSFEKKSKSSDLNDFEMPPLKKSKTFRFKSEKTNVFEEKHDESELSSILILTQKSNEEIEEVKDALKDIDSTNFFDDF